MTIKTKEVIYCDKCKSEIVELDEGFSIKGDFGFASFPNEFNGLIGTAFPLKGQSFTIDDVKQFDFCRDCFLDIITYGHDAQHYITDEEEV